MRNTVALPAAHKASTTHGKTNSRTFTTWTEMRRRCAAKHRKEFKNYGGRGIEVCPEWKDSFEAFYRDMGDRPDGSTLERRDNEGPYSKANCFWATSKEQSRNKRNSRFLHINGASMTLADAGEKFGLIPETIAWRLKQGWSDEDAVRPPRRYGSLA